MSNPAAMTFYGAVVSLPKYRLLLLEQTFCERQIPHATYYEPVNGEISTIVAGRTLFTVPERYQEICEGIDFATAEYLKKSA